MTLHVSPFAISALKEPLLTPSPLSEVSLGPEQLPRASPTAATAQPPPHGAVRRLQAPSLTPGSLAALPSP